MARPIKTGLDYFPEWKPQRITLTKILFGSNFKIIYQALRNSSAAFIRKKEVRNYIFERDNNRCNFCKSQENLVIDHITSVYRVANNEAPLKILNTKENLQTLCFKCNSGKAP